MEQLLNFFEKNQHVSRRLDKIAGAIFGALYTYSSNKPGFNMGDHVFDQFVILLDECEQSKLVDQNGFGNATGFRANLLPSDNIDEAFREMIENGGNPSDYDLTGHDYYVVLPFCALFKVPINAAIVKVQQTHQSPKALFDAIVIVSLINDAIKVEAYETDLEHVLTRLATVIIPAYAQFLIDSQKAIVREGERGQMVTTTKIQRIEMAKVEIINTITKPEENKNDIAQLIVHLKYVMKNPSILKGDIRVLMDGLKIEGLNGLIYGAVFGAICGFRQIPKQWKNLKPNIISQLEDKFAAVLQS